jgi:hypothetical protein
MSLRFRCELRTTLEETLNRVCEWANRRCLTPEWDAARARLVIWERDERLDYRDETFYWRRFTVRIIRRDGGSRVDARSHCRKWLPLAAAAFFVGLIVSALAGLAWDLVDWRGQVGWGRAVMMSLIWLAGLAFPFASWRAQRREVATQFGDLAVHLADVLDDPPAPPPPAIGPYR